jgi:uncharacterized protein (TIGR02099 family)
MNLIVKKSFKSFWYCIALIVIAFALILQAARMSLPNIDRFRHSLESYASQQLNAQVSFGKLSASWYGLRPEIIVSDLRVISDSQSPLLEIDFAQMQLDILASLFYWTPVWKKVEVDGLNLVINQDPEGGWTIAGLAGSSPKKGGRQWRYRSPGALFLMAKAVAIKSANVTFQFHNKRQLTTRIPNVSIENDGHFHRLNALAAIGGDSDFIFTLEGVGDPADPDQFFATAYLQMNHFPVERLVQLFGEVTKVEEKLPPTQAGVDLELWFDFASPSRFLVNGYFSLENKTPSDFAQNNFLDIPVHADISGDYAIATGLTLGLINLHVDDDVTVENTVINLHDDKLRVALNRLEIAESLKWVKQRFTHMPKVNSVLTTMAPSGSLENLELTIDLFDVQESILKANLVGGDINAWNNVPEFKQVNGYVEARLKQGYLLLDTDDFSMFPVEAFDSSLSFDLAKGYVGWHLAPEKNRIEIYGSDLFVAGPFGKANGLFLLDIPWQSGTRKSQLKLQVGLVDSSAEYYRQFLPKKLSPELQEWMSGAVKSGKVSQAGLFYRGGFSEGTPRSTQLFVDVQDGRLAFNPEWPEVNNIDGRLIVDNKHAFGKVKRSSFYEGDSFSGEINWNKFKQENLVVSASGQTRASNGLRFVKESWLKTVVNDVFDDWSAQGRMDLSLDLSLPILEENPQPTQSLVVNFKNNQIAMNKSRIELDKVKGRLSYSSDKGFVSKDLSVNIFDHKVPVVFGGEGSSADNMVMRASGQAKMAAIAEWLQIPIDEYASGLLNYQVDFQVPLDTEANEIPRLTLYSDLEGISIFLPPPLGKAESELLSLNVNLGFDEDDLIYTVQHDRLVAAKVIVPDEEPVKMAIAISDQNASLKRSVIDEGVVVDANLRQLDLDQWIAFSKGFAAEDGESIFDKLPIRFSLLLDSLLFQDFTLNNFVVSGQREEQGWTVIADSENIQGGLYVDNRDQQPLLLNIDYLKWPPENNKEKHPQAEVKLASEAETEESESTLKETDPTNKPRDDWANWDMSVIPLAKVNIKEFVYRDKSLGEWSFDVSSDKNNLKVDNIFAALGGFSLVGLEQEQGAGLHWSRDEFSGEMKTRFSGCLAGKDFKTLTDLWQLPPVLESKEAKFDLSLEWQGSPALFSLEHLKGGLGINIQKGVFVEENANKKTDALRLFGLMNFNTWARRLRLDFSDVVKKGFVFDSVNGNFGFDHGLIAFNDEPIIVKSPSSKFIFSGEVDYNQKNIDADLVATLPIGGNLTLATALASGLPAAAGIYIVSKIFGKQFDEVSSINYKISGNLKKPEVELLSQQEESSTIYAEESLGEFSN